MRAIRSSAKKLPSAITTRPIFATAKVLNRYDPGLDAIEAAAGQCLTSLTATAIRFAELSDMAIAIIVSTGGVIDYSFLSEPMKSLPERNWLRKGTVLPPGTATVRLAADASQVRAGARVADAVDVRDWLGGTTLAEVSEESVGLGAYGKVLTVLASATIGQEHDPDNDEESNDEVNERWTPHFKR